MLWFFLGKTSEEAAQTRTRAFVDRFVRKHNTLRNDL